ncbi:hypothetical protein NUU61_001342 [Penicillium alfredii]|uniref:Uncharacterized protein n=1 Tax=Penicillium alfredii TaxID=1506179 RepID=A0A9W9G5K5_9EURO|nr:uncharacterized protein NUU61_001342 [Penicillium alfredii]KAJ5111712.1 hypothetical protein NUU61_001342 [Penicillium alfredii]
MDEGKFEDFSEFERPIRNELGELLRHPMVEVHLGPPQTRSRPVLWQCQYRQVCRCRPILQDVQAALQGLQVTSGKALNTLNTPLFFTRNSCTPPKR